MRLIDADMVLKDIKDLQESPWHNRWSKSDSLCLQNQYVGRKEAVEIVRDLCIVKAKEVPAISLEEVKQAKEEIESHEYDEGAGFDDFSEGFIKGLFMAAKIVGKLIESEE